MFHHHFVALLTGLLGLLGAYLLVARPRLIRWGASVEEARAPYPGADLIPRGVRSGTMAVTIEAPPGSVWAWLVQMGYDRAGWYSWDRLDNWGRHSAERIHPEWQKLSIGDHVNAMPDNSIWWTVAAIEPQRFLGLRASVDLRGRPFNPTGRRPDSYSDSLWGFQLKELPGGRTRLVVSGYWIAQPRWLQAIINLFLEPAHWVMQMRQFANLKRRAERDALQMQQAA
jgi:hypothetical protein